MRGMSKATGRDGAKSIAREREERITRHPAVAVAVHPDVRPRAIARDDAHRLAQMEHRRALTTERRQDAQRYVVARDRESRRGEAAFEECARAATDDRRAGDGLAAAETERERDPAGGPEQRGDEDHRQRWDGRHRARR